MESITSHSVLTLPDQGLPYSVDTDASDYQVYVALFQTQPDDERQPIGFWSRSLNYAEGNYSTSEKKCLSVVWAMQRLRPCLQGVPFVVHSDHTALGCLLEISEPSSCLMCWPLRLGELDFRIQYKKETNNTQADALSRLPKLGGTTAPIDEDIP